MLAVLLDPVFADGARVVFAAPPHHGSNRLVDEKRAPDEGSCQSNPLHARDRRRLRLAVQVDKRLVVV
jgi:hypothetical protein